MHKDHNGKLSAPIFKIGDVVRVVDSPNDECPYGWNEKMSSYCGFETTIKKVEPYDHDGGWVYRLKIDGGRWMWCDNSIILSSACAEIDESDASIDMLLS